MSAVRRELKENVTTESERERERVVRRRETDCGREQSQRASEDILIQNDGGFSSVCV